jgi:alkylation response protein AidB-like acyl-CoA dehydrogenase
VTLLDGRQVQLLASAKAARAAIEQGAVASETARRLVDEVANVLHEAGLYWLQVPSCLGGSEADAVTAFEVLEEVSYADGSTGWNLLAGTTTLALAGAFLGDEAVAEIFADRRAVSAGQVAPLGTARADGDGYLIQGRFGFGSGNAQAGWMFGGYRQLDPDGRSVKLSTGMPNVLAAVVPKDRVTLIDGWSVIGLRGTGSLDYAVAEQLVPRGFTFPVFEAVPRRGGPLYRLGPNGLTCVAHSGFAVGVGRRALDEVAALSLTKRRVGKALLVDDPLFRDEFARAHASLAAARAHCVSALTALQEAAAVDGIGLPHRAEARLATTAAVNAATDVATFAYHASGSTGLKDGSVIQRCFRDLQAAEQHVFTDPQTYRQVGEVLLGQARPETFI